MRDHDYSYAVERETCRLRSHGAKNTALGCYARREAVVLMRLGHAAEDSRDEVGL